MPGSSLIVPTRYSVIPAVATIARPGSAVTRPPPAGQPPQRPSAPHCAHSVIDGRSLPVRGRRRRGRRRRSSSAKPCRDDERGEHRELLGRTRRARKIWLPMWAWTPTSSRPVRLAEHRDAPRPQPPKRGEAELRVLLAGHHVLVGVRLDAGGHPDEQPRPGVPPVAPSRPTRQLGQAVDLVEGVDDDPADACGERGRELVVGLVVAVA